MISFKELYLKEASGLDLDLKKMYMSFNSLYFGDELPKDIPISWYKSKRLAGEIAIAVKGRGAYKEVAYVAHLKISNVLERDKKSVVAIMLHEMIHVYVAAVLRSTESHGPEFEKKRKEISTKSGIDIPKTDAMDSLGLSSALKEKKKNHLVVLYVDKQNGAYVKLYAESSKNQKKEIIEYFDYNQKYIVKKYKIVMIGVAPTALHHTLSVKRKFDRFGGVGGGFAIQPEDFKELTSHWKSNKSDVIKVIAGK
jgi:hypothetical protein